MDMTRLQSALLKAVHYRCDVRAFRFTGEVDGGFTITCSFYGDRDSVADVLPWRTASPGNTLGELIALTLGPEPTDSARRAPALLREKERWLNETVVGDYL